MGVTIRDLALPPVCEQPQTIGKPEYFITDLRLIKPAW